MAGNGILDGVSFDNAITEGIEIPAEMYDVRLFNPMKVIRKDRTSYQTDPYYLAYFVEPERLQDNKQVKLWNELYCDIYGGFDGEWNEEYLNKLMAKFTLNRK